VVGGEAEEGEGAAVFNAMCKVPFDILFQPAPPCDGDWAHAFQFGAPKILCHRILLFGRVAI